ncbi:MAG: zinc ribbon domain-containing protein [Fervidicoccaceae archaeon]
MVHTWTLECLARRVIEVGKEHGIKVELVNEENTSSTCPLCRVKNQDHKRIYRGLLNCYKRSKVFIADLVRALSSHV